MSPIYFGETMKLLMITFFCSILNLVNIFAHNNPNYANLKLLDSLKLINENSKKSTQLYFFTDLSACYVCNLNINHLSKNYKDECEFVVFINNADNMDLSSLKNQFDENITLIGDEFGIYKEYYKVKYQPLILVLDKHGLVCGWDNVKSMYMNLDSIIKYNKQKNNNHKVLTENLELKEIKRLRIKHENKDYITSLFRESLYNNSAKSFVLVNMRQPEITFIDSSGNLIKITKLYLKEHNQIELVKDVSWAVQDSLIFIYGENRESAIFQIYNINDDSIIKSNAYNKFIPNSKYFESFNATYLTGQGRFVNSTWFIMNNRNDKLNINDTIAKIINLDGNVINIFDSPDTSYLINKRSSPFSNIMSYSSGIIYSVQQFTNKLKLWNTNGELLNKLDLDLGDNFRPITGDLVDINSDENRRKYWNMVSTFEKILIDSSRNNILISFRNETYPEGIFDFMSNECIYEIIINIYNQNGEKLNRHNIVLPKGTIPFHFENDLIYTTEMNKNKLEIAIYKFIK